jgi:uncharacterized protein YlxW (UPF0749 family)
MAQRETSISGHEARKAALPGEFEVPVLGENPTPEERADYLVKRMEQFIREGSTVAEGMSFRQWQAMAKVEIANVIADAENSVQKDDVVTKRLLFVAAAAMITIGFWGTAVSLHKVGYLAAAIVCGISGLVLLGVAGEWRFRKWDKRRRAKKRTKTLARVEDLNRRIKKLERELEDEAEGLEKELKKRFEKNRR